MSVDDHARETEMSVKMWIDKSSHNIKVSND